MCIRAQSLPRFHSRLGQTSAHVFCCLLLSPLFSVLSDKNRRLTSTDRTLRIVTELAALFFKVTDKDICCS